MLFEIYIVMLIFAFLFFIASFIKLEQDKMFYRIVFLGVAAILFTGLALGSFGIEQNQCVNRITGASFAAATNVTNFSSTIACETVVFKDVVVGSIFGMFALAAIAFLVVRLAQHITGAGLENDYENR